MAEKETCGGCRFYRETDPEFAYGLCRRHAPRPLVVGAYTEKQWAEWPVVGGDEDWCGEFQPKASEAKGDY